MATKKQEIGEKSSRIRKKFIVCFWSIFGIGVVTIVMLFWMISKGWLGYLPDIDELQNPKNKYATEIYSSDMQLLGRYFYSKDNRVHVPYSAISPNVINALVATEDERFFEHSGIDGRALMRVLIKTAILQQRNSGGGSTITQQLAKQLYSPTANNLFERILQKPNEWVIATELERLYTKQEIIAMYLNQFDFLNNAVGIKSAAQVYFNTTPSELTIEQAATLVGMCKNPSYYNPVRFNERTYHRRNTVLNQMLKADFITESECDSLKQLPLVLDFHRIDHKEGLAPYFREYLRKILMAKEPKESNYASWQKQQYIEDLDDWNNNPLYGFCNKNRKADGSPYNIYSDGLRIYTTIDSRMQHYAEEAVSKHMQDLQKTFFREKKGRSYAPFSRDITKEEINGILERTKRQSERYRVLKKAGLSKEEIDESFNTPVPMQVFSYAGMIDTVMSPLDSIRYHKHFLRCGMYSIDARNGHVKAYVGGPNFHQFQYDMATEGRRQVGSTIKPYLYTLAMEEGMWPCDKVTYQPITLLDANGREWSPKNSDRKADDLIGKEVTLQWGLTNSNNWISAYLMSLYTPESLVKLLRSFGMRGPIDPVISLCLGPCEISVAEMVDAYTAFPNKGIRIEPIYVTHIEDKTGNVIATFVPKTHEIFSAETSYKMIHMLRNVIDHGTGVRVRYKYGLDMQMGGKTGTTQNNSDGWFMGFTPSLVTGVWVGGEDRSIHFDRISDGQGANMALPIWALYMKEVLNNPDIEYSSLEEFDIPEEFNPHAGCQPL